jgi:hypothetical protein
MPLHVSSNKCSSSGGPNFINTSSSTTHSGGWLTCRSWPARQRVTHQSVLYQMMYWYNLAFLMISTCCSKHVEAWNKYIKKECVKLVINQNYVMMHGQQNIKYDVWTCSSTNVSLHCPSRSVKTCFRPTQHNITENRKLYSALLEFLSKPTFFLATNTSSVLFLINWRYQNKQLTNKSKEIKVNLIYHNYWQNKRTTFTHILSQNRPFTRISF